MGIFASITSKLNGQPQYDIRDEIQEQKRMSHFRRLYDFYVSDRDRVLEYTQRAMTATFLPKTIDKMQFPLYGLTRKVINQLAVAYLEPATRYVVVPKARDAAEGLVVGDRVAERDQEIYQGILETSNINSASKSWNRLAKLLDTVYVGVVWRDGHIEYELFPPHSLEVFPSKLNYLEPGEIRYEQQFGDEVYTIVWTPEEHRVIAENGKEVTDPEINPWGGVNKFGVIPFVPCRLSVPDDHWGEGDTELVAINEKINIAIASMFYNGLMQSHSQLFGVNTNINQDEVSQISTGPDYIIEANGAQSGDVTPSLEYISPSPSIEANILMIDWMIKQAAMMKGLSAASVDPSVSEASGVSKIVDLAELHERRRDDIEFLRPFEKRLFDVTRTVWNTMMPGEKISDNAVFGIDFQEPKLPISPLEELEIKERKMALGLYTPVDDMIDEDEGIDETQALEYLKRNIRLNREIQTRAAE